MLPLAAVYGQSGSAPVLATPSHIQYPPIARAAHVEGEVTVNFSIDSAGHTYAIETTGGAEMLRYTVEHDIGQWTFKTPLPIGAQTSFIARYKFNLHVAEDNLDDDLSGPPFTPCCGDMISNALGARLPHGCILWQSHHTAAQKVGNRGRPVPVHLSAQHRAISSQPRPA